MSSSSSNSLADLAERILEAWETVQESCENLDEIVDTQTFLGIQYAQLHDEGTAELTESSKPILEHAYETLINAQEE